MRGTPSIRGAGIFDIFLALKGEALRLFLYNAFLGILMAERLC